MNKSLIQFFILKIILLSQIEGVFLNLPFMEYASNPSKWENKLPDLASIILNEHLVEALNSQQQLTNVQSLYKEAIGKMYDRIPLQDLAEQLWKIYKKYDVQSFITMTRAQVALYSRYRLDKIQDPFYVLLAANCFYKIENDVFYSRLNAYTRHLLNISITNLPLSLQYLFGEPEFCLFNHNGSKMICESDNNNKITAKTSRVVLSLSPKNNDNLGHLQAIFQETVEDNLSDLSLALMSKDLQGYFHRLPEYGNIIGANDTQRQLENFLWSVELVDDDQLVFEQDEYLMCRNGSTVYGSNVKTIYDADCQWSARECNGEL